MKKSQEKENRTRQDLESHCGSYRPNTADQLAILAGRTDIGQGEFRALQEILNHLDRPSRRTGRKAARKSTR